jgi:hypothetical protein
MSNMADLIVQFEKALRAFIVQSAENIKFTHPQYSIRRISDGEYEISLSVTGLGTQHISIKLIGDEFMIKGKLVVLGTSAAFPFNIIADLVNGVVQKWLTQSVQSMVASKAKSAALDASSKLGKPVVAKIELLSPSTTAPVDQQSPQVLTEKS